MTVLDDPDGVLFRIETLLGRVETEDNQFGSASAGWTWWQETAEELAGLVEMLAGHLRAGGRVPVGWQPGATADWAVIQPAPPS